jgi:hypothetical protein
MNGRDLHTNINHSMTRTWLPAMRHLALGSTEHYRPSEKAGRMTGVEAAKCSPEYEVSTEMMLVIALSQTRSAHERKREAAIAFLDNILSFIVPDPELMRGIHPEDPAVEFLNLCALFRNAEGLCAHVVSVLTGITVDANPYVQFHELVDFLQLHARHCLVCKLWAHDALMSFARFVEDPLNMEHLNHDFVRQGDALTIFGTGKRKRMDAQLALHLSVDLKTDRIAPATASYLRSHPEVAANPTAIGAILDQSMLASTQAATWLACAQAVVFTLSFDGV